MGGKKSGHGRAQGKRHQGVGGGGADRSRQLHPSLRQNVRRDSGLPNLGTFSGKMERLLRKQQVKQNLRHPDHIEGAPEAKRRRLGGTNPDAPAPAQMAALVMDATRRGHEFVTKQDFVSGDGALQVNRSKEISKRRFWKEFQKVVSVSDVLLEVLDARDPLGGRLGDVERAIESAHAGKKQFVLVLNKVDLIPRENAERWLEYFRHEGMPVVAFSAAGGGKAAAHERSKTKDAEDPTRRCVEHMFEVLRRFQRAEGGGRRRITVGVIGYPNVGKSSIINALKRRSVVGVGNTAGFTTAAQEVHLQQHIKVMDCPGVVVGEGDDADVVLRNAMKVDQVVDPVRPVELIWDRCGAQRLSTSYQLPAAELHSFDAFVRVLGQKWGRLRRGGDAIAEDVCRQVLRDWNDGKIPFFTVPPSDRDALAGPGTMDPTAMEQDQETHILNAFSVQQAGAGFAALAPSRPQDIVYGIDDERLRGGRGRKRGAPGADATFDDEDEWEDMEEEGEEGGEVVMDEYDDRDELEQLARDVKEARRAEAQAEATARGRAAAAEGGEEEDDGMEEDERETKKKPRRKGSAAKLDKIRQRRILRAKRSAQ
eukprot:Hpha_TRINITY_DN15243_c2_g2::TRINITY_DN15243_c2_g2_i1::g.65951::m.65951/K14538/NUG1, GNL3; nuclear GTP-binding protein